MGIQIIPEKYGKTYSLFSSVTDSFLAIEMSEEEVVQWFVKEAMEDTARHVNEKLAAIKKGERAYHQFTMTWKEAYATHKQHCPEDAEFNEAVDLLARSSRLQ